MTLRRFGVFSALLLIGLSLSKGTGAQTATSGGLTGVVTDPSNAVVPDANVELNDNAKGTVKQKSRILTESTSSLLWHRETTRSP